MLRSPGAGAELCSPGSLRRVSRPGGRCDIALCPAWQRPRASWTCWRDHSQSLACARLPCRGWHWGRASGVTSRLRCPWGAGALRCVPLGWTGSRVMELGTFPTWNVPGLRFVPLRWGRQGWQRGAAALCARAIDSGSQGKWDQSGREGGGDGSRPPPCAGAARARGEALSYLWLVLKKRPLAAREREDGSLITTRLCCVIINYPWQKITY